MSPSVGSSAEAEGPVWSAAASGWVTYWARFAAPAREAVAQAAGIEAGISVLDVGCGSGEFCELAAARGAGVSGIDAAGLIEFARRRFPGADLRVGPIFRHRFSHRSVISLNCWVRRPLRSARSRPSRRDGRHAG